MQLYINILVEIANSEPKNVATPFPPLNERKGDVVCPSTVKNIVIGKNLYPRYFLVIITGNTPFKKSIINVKIPNKNPAVRITFVVPGFFDPTVRISTPLNILVNIKAVGILPIMYDKKNIIKFFIIFYNEILF